MKNILIILFIILSLFKIYSDEYHSYKPYLVEKFYFGDKIDEFLYNDRAAPTEWEGVYAFTFDNNGYLHTTDTWAKRIVVFDNQFKFFKDVKLNVGNFFPKQFNIFDNKIISNAQGLAFTVYDLTTGELLIDIGMNKNKEGKFIAHDSFVYASDSVFFWLRNGDINMIEKPVKNKKENRQLTRNNLETKEIINKKKQNIFIDDNNRLFLNEELITRDYDTWYTYWDEIHKRNKEKGPHLDFSTKPESFLNNSIPLKFMGKDIQGNFYWSKSRGFLLVFNPDKWLIDMFLINLDIDSFKTQPAVHPSGDIYFMDYDSKEIQLYRIKNTWAPFPWNPPIEEQADNITYGTLTANGVRVRQEPNLRAKPLDFMGKDNRVEILDQTAKAMKIGEMESVWYKVRRLSDGLEGWVYGWFVKIEAP